MVADFNHTFSATMLVTFRYGFTYSDFHRNPLVGYGFDVTTLGLPAEHEGYRDASRVPALGRRKDSRSSAPSRTGSWIGRKASTIGPAR